jgi:glycine C-acetyltransferase
MPLLDRKASFSSSSSIETEAWGSHMAFDSSEYSLADFFMSDSTNVLDPPSDYAAWRMAVQWATSLYEPTLRSGPIPRTTILYDGVVRPTLNFASYNYLGLAQHPDTVAAARQALLDYGTGACGSPMLSGMTGLHRELEDALSAFRLSESTILFNSGYAGAVGLLAGLLRRGDVFVIDDKSHICVIEGAKLAQARLVMFEHNDPASLAACLEKHKGQRVLVGVEGVYSMDGDMADLPALLEVTEAFGAPMLIDEAHSTLTCGPSGRGVVEHFGVEDRVALKYTTFSKGFATMGGAVSGPRETLDYVRFYANAYGFSAALPPPVAAATLAAISVAKNDPGLREQLWANATYFRTRLNEIGVDTGASTSFVVPIHIGDNRAKLYELCHEMRRKGLFLPPVDFPTVPQDQVRFRASITAAHTRADLDEALNIIEDTVVRAVGRRI